MKRCPDCGWPMEGNTCQRCKLADYDCNQYMQFTGPAVIDKTINTLEGILTGLSIDNELNEQETNDLLQWSLTHSYLADRRPFDELFNTIFIALEDDILALEEKEDLLWLCKKLHSNGLYYDTITSDMQKLQGIFHGILSDGVITKKELEGLKEWLSENEQLATYHPYDEVFSLVTSVLKDGKVSLEEEHLLKAFFSQFVENSNACEDLSEEERNLFRKQGICALAPDVVVEGHSFCFTGKSTKASRTEIAEIINNAGGKFKNNVNKDTNYLIVGNEGNPCWAFACYGRKIEKAIELRQQGNHIVIVNEVDFWDSIDG